MHKLITFLCLLIGILIGLALAVLPELFAITPEEVCHFNPGCYCDVLTDGTIIIDCSQKG